MILLLGVGGYMGRAFARVLTERSWPFRAVRRSDVDYTKFEPLVGLLRQTRPEFLIHAAGFTGKPNVDACESARAETLLGNVLLPQTISHACSVEGIAWGHISSGCIYNGAKILENGKERVEKDLTQPALRQLARETPDRLRGFTEVDEPNFSFRNPPCSFYSGTKALAEEVLRDDPRVYVWRLRIPFDQEDDPRNFLTKLRSYPKVYDNLNSLSHRTDFVRACLDLWKLGAPPGLYNVTNPGFVSSRHVVALIQRHLDPKRVFEFWADDEEFYRMGVRAPRSNCILDSSKLLGAGVPMRPVEEALVEALQQWRSRV